VQHHDSRSVRLEQQSGGQAPLTCCDVQRAQMRLQPVEQEAVALAEVSLAAAVEEEHLRVRRLRGQPDHQPIFDTV